MNILQLLAIDAMTRKQDREIVLGITPLSHVQGVVAIHSSIYLRDQMILHSKFDMQAALMSIKTYRINRLYVVSASVLQEIYVRAAFMLTKLSY